MGTANLDLDQHLHELIDWQQQSFKTLGVYFSKNMNECYELV